MMKDLNVHLNSPFVSSLPNKNDCREFSKMSISDGDYASKGVMSNEPIIRSKSFGSIEDRCQRQQKRFCYQDSKFRHGVLEWCDATAILKPVAETPSTIQSLDSSSASSVRSDLSTDIQDDVFSMTPSFEGAYRSGLSKKLGFMKRAEQSTCLASLDETSCYQETTAMSSAGLPFHHKNTDDWGYFVDSC